MTSFNCGGTKPLITVFDHDIIVASKNGKLLVLDAALTIKKQYNTIDYEPQCLSATGKYIAIGTEGKEVIFYDRNGSTEQRVRIKLKK